MPSASSVSAAANVSFTIAPQLINVTSRPSLRTKATIQRHGLAVVFNLASRRAVDACWLQEHHRIGVADGREQQAVSSFGRRWNDHAQTRNVGEHGLGALGVMFGSANAAPMRGA